MKIKVNYIPSGCKLWNSVVWPHDPKHRKVLIRVDWLSIY